MRSWVKLLTISFGILVLLAFLSAQMDYIGVPKMTNEQYNQLEIGMEIEQVHEIVGRDGIFVQEYKTGSIDRVVYKYCDKLTKLKHLMNRKFIYLSFDNGKLYRFEKTNG